MSAPICPTHRMPLYGGPVEYQCLGDDSHTVRAADIDREYHAPQEVAS